MEALDGWEIELALTVNCPRCEAKAGERCVKPVGRDGAGEPSTIHPLRLNAYYDAQKAK
jgi:hypothetical protein